VESFEIRWLRKRKKGRWGEEKRGKSKEETRKNGST
jgi:hypothetical protein